MQTFEFDGKTYSFDANSCYNNNSFIGLPDGRYLSVGLWLESYPPQPDELEVVKIQVAYNVVQATLVNE